MKVSFFNLFKKSCLTISYVLLLFLISGIIVSFVCFEHRNNKISYQNIEIYQQEDITDFKSYFKDEDLFIIIKLKTKKEKAYLMDYAYHYYQKYIKNIYLEAQNEEDLYYVNVNLDGFISIV